ncbi:MAG: hypothetical protein PHI71_08400 [Acidiphilium sp.]|nr:hypothetical protein [Acidiphilium sp.]
MDQDGLITTARDVLFARMREYIQQFYDVRNAFNDRFQPFQAELSEYEEIGPNIRSLELIRDQEIAKEKSTLDKDPIVEEYSRTKSKYDDQVKIHAHKPNMKAVSSRAPFDVNPVYLAMMLILGTAEWFINYDTLFTFFNVPIIAIGATFVLALCLAVIAHQHGLDLKQWKKKFGPAVEPRDRPYGILILASVGLVALITVTGWMRFQSLMSVMQSQNTANIIGTKFSVQIDPEREVIVSLGANFLAWLVGVFVSYFAHDPDPVYVETALDFQKSQKGYARKKAVFDKVKDRIERQCKEKIEEQQHRASKFSSSLSLKEAKILRDQAMKYEDSFRERAMTYFIVQYSRIKQEIVAAISSTDGQISMFKRDKNTVVPISLNDYQALSFEGITLESFM